MKCRRCKVRMKIGQRLVNTPSMGIPDFPGDGPDSIGQTMTSDGPVVMVNCWKCPECGGEAGYVEETA